MIRIIVFVFFFFLHFFRITALTENVITYWLLTYLVAAQMMVWKKTDWQYYTFIWAEYLNGLKWNLVIN